MSYLNQFSSDAQSCLTLCDPMNCSTPGLPVHHQLPEFTQTHIHQVSDAIQPSHPLLSPSPPAPNPSQYQSLFQWVNCSHEVPKYWSFSFSIIPSKEIPGLISFRMDRLDILATQGTFKSLLQHHSSKASILWRSAFFTVQLSHPYMTTRKTITLTRRTFVGKVMSLLLNMLSRLVITFLPRSKHLLISWLQSPSEWSGVFPYFLPFKSEFGNKGFMIQATVSSWSFCWLYRASPSLAAKNIINLISVLTIWWCPCVESSLMLLEEGVCYDQCILFAKLYFSLYPASFCTPRPNLPVTPGVSSYFCILLAYNEKDIFGGC